MSNIDILQSNLTKSPRMPVLFVGHGNPMNAVMDNKITENWNKIGKTFPEAKAIVFISAHWFTKGTFISSAVKQNLIYDFYGFPEDLYNVRLDINGNPDVASQIKDYLKYETYLDNNRGLDHGTWTVLKHLMPENNIPVFQISLNINHSLEDLMKFFENLRPLRDQGVIFIGSGNLIHNLRLINPYSEGIEDWALEFDEKIKDTIDKKENQILTNPYKLGTSARIAIPTDDHYRPMLAAMSLLYPNEQIEYFNEDIFDMGSIGMRSFISQKV